MPGPGTSVIEWVDPTSTDSTPAFNVELPFGNGAPIDVAVGDVLEFRRNGIAWFNHAIIQDDIDNNPIELSGITPLDDGDYDIDIRLTRTGAIPADWSDVASGSIDTVAPTITTSATANNPENNVLAIALTADEAVTWAIRTSAEDAASVDYDEFEINGTTLRWTSNGTRDYEIPVDDDTNNTYIVVIRATDAFGHTTDKTITVTVTDEDDQLIREWSNAGGIYLNQTARNARQWMSASGIYNIES